ncbi:Ribosomal RNA small subunit methyltransferase G [Spirochaeta thermophila DSM 6578]|uniref:Ribosomal RNA small subunit methyltransferase G n=1 Tax=Winmispira thermophila (strain ATCC 700085 / DSM 6578 / Z-1203) TaxID=869211 RepID=G0GDD7_WINT7|nr:16S rRNA (guanine(527)-N(7))-methyltransferase RsmG [Spirochaeta thermophila]AEJ60563.1 Ribosomal RNA small subunit methyltransferase G [Spirochaeta thermophila DSM 6578]
MQDPASLLDRGLALLGLSPTPSQRAALLSYLHLLAEWGSRIDLVADPSPEALVVHLLDSLAPLPHLRAFLSSPLADLGSGAGLPGIPLAIMNPHLEVLLVEAREKRAVFLEHVLLSVDLARCTVLHARLEDLPLHVPCAVARAFLPLSPGTLPLYLHPLSPGAHLLLYKGRLETAQEEARLLRPHFEEVEAVPVSVPFLDTPRSLIAARGRLPV